LDRLLLIFLTLFVFAFSSAETTTAPVGSETPVESSDCPLENQDSVAYQCASGVYNNVVSLLQLPGNLMTLAAIGQQRLEACNSNPEIKRGLLLVLEPMINVPQWMGMSCEQIIQASNLQERSLLRSVSAKRTEQSRIQRLIEQSASDPTRLAFLNRRLQQHQLSESEQNFLNRYMARENLVDRLSGADIRRTLSCATYREILSTTCEFIVGAGAVGLTAKLARPVGRGIQNTTAQLLARSQSFRSIVGAFQNSSRVEFYTANGRVSNLTINPGDTFTVIIKDGRLILGRDIPGETGIPGGNGSHVTLMRLMGEPDPYRYYGRGGAVRFNDDGSIDISGYHLEDDGHPRAFRDIEEVMRGINPNTSYRSTPDRLSTLPPLESR
jgi:hypothetical protein